MNTYGLGCVNHNSFGKYEAVKINQSLKKQFFKEFLISAFKIYNLTLTILGYIPGISFFSGCTRIAGGFLLGTFTLILGGLKGELHLPIYEECLKTSGAQMIRGFIEGFVPFGWTLNLILDLICTPNNLDNSIECQTHEHVYQYNEKAPKYKNHSQLDPDYYTVYE